MVPHGWGVHLRIIVREPFGKAAAPSSKLAVGLIAFWWALAAIGWNACSFIALDRCGDARRSAAFLLFLISPVIPTGAWMLRRRAGAGWLHLTAWAAGLLTGVGFVGLALALVLAERLRERILGSPANGYLYLAMYLLAVRLSQKSISEACDSGMPGRFVVLATWLVRLLPPARLSTCPRS